MDMCTVTLVPKGKNDFILTSNRDEAPVRAALLPEISTQNNTKLLFPKDEVSGGSWIGVSEQNRVVCVLNGAFDLHERKKNYRRSRGLLATDVLLFENLEQELTVYNFQNIEPFTMVIVDWNQDLRFFEFVWDGEVEHFKQLPIAEHIWSSSTLYTNTMKQERRFWFEDFKSENKLTSESLLKFHKSAGQGNLDYGVVMDRGFVKTTSVTQVIKSNAVVSMCYESLINELTSCKTMKLPEPVNE